MVIFSHYRAMLFRKFMQKKESKYKLFRHNYIKVSPADSYSY